MQLQVTVPLFPAPPPLQSLLLLCFSAPPITDQPGGVGWGRGCCPACLLPDVYICLCPDGEPQHWALVCGYSTQAGSPSSGAHFPRDRQRGTLHSQPSPTSGHCPDPVSQPKSHGVTGQAHRQHPETTTHPTLPRLGMSGLSPEMGNIWRNNQQALPEARELLIQARAAPSFPSFQPPPTHRRSAGAWRNCFFLSPLLPHSPPPALAGWQSSGHLRVSGFQGDVVATVPVTPPHRLLPRAHLEKLVIHAL